MASCLAVAYTGERIEKQDKTQMKPIALFKLR